MSKIAIIDYDIGNVRSIINAFESFGISAKLTRDRAELLNADGVVLPGVGAFAHGMDKLEKYDLRNIIDEVVNNQIPLLGICLGMQLLFSSSSEFGDHEGLGLIPGKVLKLPLLNDTERKLPHISWNELSEAEHSKWEGSLLNGVEVGTSMYFVHSYYVEPDNQENILSTTTYSGFEFCSTVNMGNIFGCQYHPEKSGDKGLRIIRNFNEICKAVKL